MVAQIQPGERGDERPITERPRRRANPRPKTTKKKRGTPKRRAGIAGWVKWLASSVGLIAALTTAMVGLRQIIPAHAKPRIEADGQAWLIRSAKNNQLELRVNLTLLNEGAKVALIPRPTVSLYVDSPDRVLDIPADDLHFKSADGASEIIFPVSLHEGAGTFERQIICSIAGGRDGDWYQPGLLHLNLVFRPKGHEAVNRCLVFTSPVPESIQQLPPDGTRTITINDCLDFGEGFTKRTGQED